MNDERWNARQILANLELPPRKGPVKFLLSLAGAAVIAFVPSHEGLEPAGIWTLFILVWAAALWITEAIPAFAVAILVIGLEIAILGRPGGVFAKEPGDWTMFVEPWASPVIWLFFGGFVLAEAAGRTGLDRWLSRLVLSRCGGRPYVLLAGVMGITFLFSMFVSNTATTAMMIAVTAPIIGALAAGDRFSKALLLGVPFAAGLGGMVTVIGSPPNAIAHGLLTGPNQLNFVQWMFVGLPPALVMLGIIWFFLCRRYPAVGPVDVEFLDSSQPFPKLLPLWQRLTVMLTFFITVALWMTGPLHGIPTPVVSFVPITVFAVTGVVGSHQIRRLHWDILLLLTGGLALGVAVSQTGLAEWLVNQLPTGSLGPLALTLALAYLCAILSNFMSNTAAANILIPLAAALNTAAPAPYVLPVALAASAAMCLPVSTPPNAIAFAEGSLEARDFLAGGVLVGLLAPGLVVFWSRWVLGGN
jgi:solute carrier family 13 (sodium-dependent dicarboxylate transporter), member 2/3/5